jgi:hypothetical protein
VSTYLAASGLEQLDAAQAVIDRHLVACLVCGTNRPCGERREAEAVFLRFGRLPERKPGPTNHAQRQPDGSGRGWFDRTSGAEHAA